MIPPIRELLRAFMVPFAGAGPESADAPMLFMQLLGRGYIDRQGHLRTFISQRYGAVLAQIQRRRFRRCRGWVKRFCFGVCTSHWAQRICDVLL